MKRKSLIISLVLLIVIGIIFTQVPGVYAIPDDYSDYEGIIISADDDLHNQLPNDFCYSFRSSDDNLTVPWSGWNGDGQNHYDMNTIVGYFGKGNQCKRTIVTGARSPYPDIPAPTSSELSSNPSLFWDYMFTISPYWKIYTTELKHYGNPLLFLKPYSYVEPEFYLECNPSQISANETSICTLKANYRAKLKSLSFKLDTGDYIISDVVAGAEFENLQVNGNAYSLDGKSTLVDADDGRVIDVLSFKVRSDKDVVDSTDNIKVVDLQYKDQLTESPAQAAAATVKKAKTDNSVNPITKRNSVILLLLFVLAVPAAIGVGKKQKDNDSN